MLSFPAKFIRSQQVDPRKSSNAQLLAAVRHCRTVLTTVRQIWMAYIQFIVRLTELIRERDLVRYVTINTNHVQKESFFVLLAVYPLFVGDVLKCKIPEKQCVKLKT